MSAKSGQAQFSVDVMEGASVSNIPLFPPFLNSNVRSAYAQYVDEFGRAYPASPWNLASDVGRSPHDGFDVQFVSASADRIDFSTLASAPCTTPVETCSILASGYPLNRLYVGRFNITRDPQASGVNVRVGGAIEAIGLQLQSELQALSGTVVFVEYPVPGAATFPLVSTLLGGLVLRRSIRSHHARTICGRPDGSVTPAAGKY